MLVLCQLLHVLFTLYIIFMHFSGTNLLTRCHSASSCFLLFSVSEKYLRKYSRNWTGQKAAVLEFRELLGARRRPPGGPWAGHTLGWRGSHPWRATMWCGAHGTLPTPPFRLYIPPDASTLRRYAIFDRNTRAAAAIADKFRGSKVPAPAPCRRGD